MSFSRYILLSHLLCRTVKVHSLYLFIDILAIISRHLHALVVVLQRAVAHLQRLYGYGRYAAQVSLIALALQYGLLPQFYLVLLLQFSNHGFQEFLLVLPFFDSVVDLDLDALLHPFLVLSVASHLGEKLESLEGSGFLALLVEVLAVVTLAEVSLLFQVVGSPVLEDSSASAQSFPLSDPPHEEILIFLKL